MGSNEPLVVALSRRFVLERLLKEVVMSSGDVISDADYEPSSADTPSPSPPPYNSRTVLCVVLAYVVTFGVVLIVLQRLYVHKYHFTPPYLRAYRQLVAARSLVRNGALAWDAHQQLGPFTSVPAGPRSPPAGGGGDGGGSAGPSGATNEIVSVEDPAMHLSSEVLAWLEQDLRASSIRERERLAAALGADLPPGQEFFFPIHSNSARIVLPPEFDRSLNSSLTRATQSARFARVGVSPPSSASASLGGDGLPPQRRSSFSQIMSRTLLPSEFNPSDLTRAVQSAGFTSVNRASASVGASPSTSRPGSYRWTTNQASSSSNPPPNRPPSRAELP